MLKSPLTFLALTFLSVLCASNAFAQARVVASIKPLQLIAAAITDGVSEPAVIIPANQSPHHFTLRPSDVSRLVQADVVLWVGAGMETYLTGVLQRSDGAAKVIEAATLASVRLLPLTQDEHGHGHPGGQYDPHLWLDTGNAMALAQALHDELVLLDATNAARYSSNLAHFESSLTALEKDLQQRFTSLRGIPYAVYHNGTHYLEKQMGLEHAFVLVPDHEIQPGIRHLLAIRSSLQTLRPVCLLQDINTNEATVKTVFQGYSLRQITLDTLGDTQPLGRDGYVGLINTLASAIAVCLAP